MRKAHERAILETFRILHSLKRKDTSKFIFTRLNFSFTDIKTLNINNKKTVNISRRLNFNV